MTNDDMLSQEEINALLNENIEEDHSEDMEFHDLDDLLTDMEKDTLGEIGNISMGTAATTLSTLLNQKVNITTPTVTITSSEELSNEYPIPFVAIDVSYREGLKGSNVLILHTDDVKVITDLMMGKDGVDTDRELTELDLSAVGEAMNQMMGSASTSLSEMLDKKIDIEPPKSLEITFSEGKEKVDLLKEESPIIKISFRMEIGDYIDSNIMQLVPIEFGKEMVAQILGSTNIGEKQSEDVSNLLVEEPIVETFVDEPIVEKAIEEPVRERQVEPRIQEERKYRQEPVRQAAVDEPVIVSKPVFQSFAESDNIYEGEIDLVGDIPVEITVELGRTHKKIGEILEFGMGTVIELEKLVGESLNIYANGKYIAKGEVVVIDDNFGVRLTEIDKNQKQII